MPGGNRCHASNLCFPAACAENTSQVVTFRDSQSRTLDVQHLALSFWSRGPLKASVIYLMATSAETISTSCSSQGIF